MGKLILAAILAALVLFIWNFLAWMFLPHHSMTMHSLHIDEGTVAALAEAAPSPGVYHYPPWTREDGEEAMEAYTRLHESGPVIAGMVFLPQGGPVMPPVMFLMGFLNYLVAALLASILLNQARAGFNSYGQRVVFCAVLGLFATIVVDLPMAIWMYTPASYTMAMMLDHIVGWIFAGLVIAALVKPAAAETSELTAAAT